MILDANNITMIFRNGTQYIVMLTDSLGNPIANTNMIKRVNGVNYSCTTDNNGESRLSLNLNPGTYTITTIFGGNSEFNNNSITTSLLIISTITWNDLTKYFLNASQYSVKVTDSNGTALINETVTFNINGVFYDVTSGSDGIARLNITLDPGSYIATATWNGLSTINTIKVI